VGDFIFIVLNIINIYFNFQLVKFFSRLSSVCSLAITLTVPYWQHNKHSYIIFFSSITLAFGCLQIQCGGLGEVTFIGFITTTFRLIDLFWFDIFF